MKFGIVSRRTSGAFRYQAWPTLAKGEDGTLFAATSGLRRNHICPFGKNLMYVSYDQGETWSAPQIINDTWFDDRDAGLLAWGEKNLLLTWFNHPIQAFEKWEEPRPQHEVTTPLALGMRALWETLPEEELKFGSFTRISRDNGKTWSDPRPAPVSSPHGPCRLQDGSLLYVGTIVAENGGYEPKSGERQVQAFRSTDDGETWQFLSVPPVPEGDNGEKIYEPHAIQLANGDIMIVVRKEPAEPPVMKRLRLYTAISHDCGKTWEKAEFLDQCGAPGHLLQHSSGAVVLIYSRRCEPRGQYVRVSRDFGKTWSKDVMVSPEAPDWDHGYPSSVELDNGDILSLYYQKCPGDTYNSLLSTRFSLDEIEK